VRRVPILRTRHRGADYLVSLSGESQWLRNARAAHGRATIRRRGSHQVQPVEVPPEDRAEVIAAYLRAAERRSGTEAATKAARRYLGLALDAGREDIRAVADFYPVLRIEYLG
jgi:hypothetical protein